MHKVDSQRLAAKMVFMCAKYADRIFADDAASEADKRHALLLRSLGIKARDHNEALNTKKMKECKR